MTDLDWHTSYNLDRRASGSYKFISIPTSTKPILFESFWDHASAPNSLFCTIAGNYAYRPRFKTVHNHAASDPVFITNLTTFLRDVLRLDTKGIKLDLAHNDTVGHRYQLKFDFGRGFRPSLLRRPELLSHDFGSVTVPDWWLSEITQFKNGD